jgi:phosphate starvation-inducible PhoH-like protein
LSDLSAATLPTSGLPGETQVSGPASDSSNPRATTLQFSDNARLAMLLGDHDRHLVRLEQGLGVRLSCRGNRIALAGDPGRVALARSALTAL